MHVFVSHSRENSSAAFRLCEELRTYDIQTWIDLRDLKPGAEWGKSVADAIREAAGIIFIIGATTAADRYQSFEWQQVIEDELYLDPSKPLIPVLIGNPELPGFLRTRQTLSLDDTQASFDAAAEGIAKALADPSASVDESKLELGRKVRVQALESLRQYSLELGDQDVKRAGTRVKE
jgi:hypothetical protein